MPHCPTRITCHQKGKNKLFFRFVSDKTEKLTEYCTFFVYNINCPSLPVFLYIVVEQILHLFERINFIRHKSSVFNKQFKQNLIRINLIILLCIQHNKGKYVTDCFPICLKILTVFLYESRKNTGRRYFFKYILRPFHYGRIVFFKEPFEYGFIVDFL